MLAYFWGPASIPDERPSHVRWRSRKLGIALGKEILTPGRAPVHPERQHSDATAPEYVHSSA